MLSTPTDDFINRSILQNIDYTNYLLQHKLNVAKAGLQIGLPVGTLIKHDYTKFYPSLYKPYKEYFFGSKGIRNKKGVDLDTYKAFRKAVDFHYEHESHHNDKVGKIKPIMSELESVADWYSVNKTNANMNNKDFPNFKEWWNEHKDNFLNKNKISKQSYLKIESNV